MYKDLPDDELIRRIHNSSNTGWVGPGPEGPQAEITRRLLESNRTLNNTIIDFNKSSKHYSNILIWLTGVLIFLTLLMTLAVAYQIYLILKS